MTNGEAVIVLGTTTGDNALTALTVRVSPDRATGTVTSKTSSTIVIELRDGSSKTINVDGDTIYRVAGKDDAGLADVTVDMVIGVGGRAQSDGSIDADTVVAGRQGGGFHGGDGFRGGRGGSGPRARAASGRAASGRAASGRAASGRAASSRAASGRTTATVRPRPARRRTHPGPVQPGHRHQRRPDSDRAALGCTASDGQDGGPEGVLQPDFRGRSDLSICGIGDAGWA